MGSFSIKKYIIQNHSYVIYADECRENKEFLVKWLIHYWSCMWIILYYGPSFKLSTRPCTRAAARVIYIEKIFKWNIIIIHS